MRLTKGFVLGDLEKGQNIIIYGAGNYGEIALRGLEELGVKVCCFADRALSGKLYMGIPVIAPEELSNHKDDIVLIASMNHFAEMYSYLVELGFDNFYDISEVMNIDIPKEKLSEYALDEIKNPHKYMNVIENLEPEKFVIGHCEVVVTERCSLKCKDCANLMPYYKAPKEIEMKNIISTLDNFMNSIDLLLDLRILGGEPFLCRNLDVLLEYAIKHEKIKGITIDTNSTIIPIDKVMQHLKNNKVVVHMSDYGKVSRQLETLHNKFVEENVKHYIHHYEKWHDIGGLDKRSYSSKQMEELFKSCVMAKCYTFYRGGFYLCPRSAHGNAIGAFNNNFNEYVDFNAENIDFDLKREELKKLISNTKFLTACNYCNGSNSRSKEVTAGVQL